MKISSLVFALSLSFLYSQSGWPLTNNKIDPRFTQAKRMELSGNIVEAKKLYMQLLNEYPENYPYYKAIKKILRNSNSLDELKKMTINLIKKNQSDSIYELDLLEIYLWLNDAKAKNLNNELFEKFKSNETLLKKLIFIYISNGRDKEAQDMINSIRLKKRYIDFYAFELAIHSMTKMNYEGALEEFLVVLKHNPKKYAFVSERIMVFPDDTELMNRIETILKESDTTQSNLLLSDLYYKQGKYYQSWKIIKNYGDELRWIEMAKDLVNDNRFAIGEKIINEILESTPSKQNQNTAIFLLAEVFERSLMKVDEDLALSKLFEGNYFFNQSFPTIDEEKTENLYKAMALYDSITINFSNVNANYRLAEINYKIFGDFDKAFSIYDSIARISPKKMIRFKSDIAKVDVLISKGDLDRASELAEGLSAKYSSKDYSNLINMKINQINFYGLDFDNAKNSLLEMLKDMKFDHSSYNNIVDVVGVLQIFDQNQEQLKLYSSAQFLLRQNKRVEAISILKSIEKTNNEIINELVAYQIAYLYYKQNNFNDALKLSEKINGISFYSEKALIFQAEINDYILNNKAKAVEHYLEFIDKYPLSIYYDPIRLRLRKIAS